MPESVVTLVSIFISQEDEDERQEKESVQAKEDGLEGDKYRGFTRVAKSWDSEPKGTVRRNERQWSAVSMEDLAEIASKMDLAEPLAAQTLGANFCLEGAPGLSVLPRGSKLVFPSGAVLMVEEETMPCAEMGDEIERIHTTRSGSKVKGKMFPKHAIGLRGTLGFVDVVGEIKVGDKVLIRSTGV